MLVSSSTSEQRDVEVRHLAVLVGQQGQSPIGRKDKEQQEGFSQNNAHSYSRGPLS